MSLRKSLNSDLSPSAVKRSVLKETLQGPLTSYGGALACLAGGYALLIGASPVALGALAVGGSVAAGNWVWQYIIKGDKNANAFVQRFRQQLKQQRIQALKVLRSELDEVGDVEGMKQIELFQEKFDTFVSVLSRKLDPAELTYNRYLTIAEQVYLGGIDNLENAALALKSISAIDVDHIQQQLQRLKSNNQNKDSGNDNNDERIVALEKRLVLRSEQLQRAHMLRLENEKALTQLDEVSTRIASINTKSGRSDVDLEESMKELQYLIQRAENYSKTS